jgi:hypothetical protein
LGDHQVNALRQISSVFQDEIPNFVTYRSGTSSLTIRGARIRVTQPRSRWVVELKDRFDELTALPYGWDGYGGRPVSFNCAQFTANLLERLFVEGVPAPQLVPGGDGTIQFEWHRNNFDVEIDVLAPYEVVAIRRDHRSNQVQELDLQTDFTSLSDWIAELGQPKPQTIRAGA